MASFETWAFLPTFDTSWISETFARDTDTDLLANTSDVINVSFSETPSVLIPVNSVSTSGGSEPETPPVFKRPPRNAATKKKISKRKTRKSKRSPTTFIIADPDNFSQMVQQVTGVQFGSVSGPILKSEPHRRVGFGSGHFLPTLDTSAFLLDNVGLRKVGDGPTVGSAGGSGFDFDGLTCFPTLESWKVM